MLFLRALSRVSDWISDTRQDESDTCTANAKDIGGGS